MDQLAAEEIEKTAISLQARYEGQAFAIAQGWIERLIESGDSLGALRWVRIAAEIHARELANKV